MVHLLPLLPILAFAFGVSGDEENEEDLKRRYSRCDPGAGSVHQFMVETLDGRNESMSRYSGNTLMIINVATF